MAIRTANARWEGGFQDGGGTLAVGSGAFSGQPYSILALWGWTARKEEVWQCYSLAGTTLISRPIRLLKGQPS